MGYQECLDLGDTVSYLKTGTYLVSPVSRPLATPVSRGVAGRGGSKVGILQHHGMLPAL